MWLAQWWGATLVKPASKASEEVKASEGAADEQRIAPEGVKAAALWVVR